MAPSSSLTVRRDTASSRYTRSGAASFSLSFARVPLIGIGLITALVNVLYLTGSFYMLEVYDRVIPSRSVPTLVGLSVLAFAMYAFQGALDIVRARVLVRIGAALDANLSGRVYEAVARLPLRTPAVGDGLQPLRDLDQVRNFMSGLGPAAFFDLPWMPLYVGICFLFHPWIGVAALLGAVLLVLLTILTDAKSSGPARETVALGQRRNSIAESARRNAEVLQAMGMRSRLGSIWSETNDKYSKSQQLTSDVAGGLGAVSKVARMALQSAVLGLGAYLVIQQQVSAGAIIASSILTARALAPVEMAIANWKGFVAARQSWRRLRDLLSAVPPDSSRMALPAPVASLSVEGVAISPPGAQRLVVADTSFVLQAGQGLGIIGPSASGKSSLARSIVGIWAPVRGRVRLDGAALDQWSADDLGPHIGYLPQDVELFAGTVAENIARFAPEPDATAVIKAAKSAGVHELVLRLPEGYETQIGEGGAMLSGGQRQRLGLARALYGDPFLVVLDEPNSNLDGEGEQALTKAILGVRQRGGIVVIVAHRPSALAGVDTLLVLADGRVQAFGPKDEVMARVTRPQGASHIASSGITPLRVVKEDNSSGS
jgi:ATP-binding cassette subfamily C protein